MNNQQIESKRGMKMLKTAKHAPTKIDVLDGDWTTEEVLNTVNSHKAMMNALQFALNIKGVWETNQLTGEVYGETIKAAIAQAEGK